VPVSSVAVALAIEAEAETDPPPVTALLIRMGLHVFPLCDSREHEA
jgi:hypothetical protein